MENITGYKGFDKNMKCQKMQYEVGKTYKIPDNKKLVCCPSDEKTEAGLHFCENPLNVFDYYSPADSKFSEVEAIGNTKKHGDDSKVATSELYIKANIFY